MAAVASTRQIPSTPTVIAPSPDGSDYAQQDGYFVSAPPTGSRRSSRIANRGTPARDDSSSDPDRRARSKSKDDGRKRRMSGMTAANSRKTANGTAIASKRLDATAGQQEPDPGHLSPAATAKRYWRELSRSPSPLGLIPIHTEWRTFIHKHEVPRKVLHVSIGFVTLGLYATGFQTTQIHPVLLGLLIPIASTDVVRHHWPAFNRFYISVLGALMRESEAHDRYNGVIWYLLGAWAALRFFPKDIGVMSVVLLSWSDTAASTIGRLYGKYTPKIRQGKSLAGTLAACTVGVVAALFFWGFWAPHYESLGQAANTGPNTFGFQGSLHLPPPACQTLGLSKAAATVSGGVALGIMSICAGVVAAASEAVDIFGMDDNLTIPILCGIGLWGFLKAFGAA